MMTKSEIMNMYNYDYTRNNKFNIAILLIGISKIFFDKMKYNVIKVVNKLNY